MEYSKVKQNAGAAQIDAEAREEENEARQCPVRSNDRGG